MLATKGKTFYNIQFQESLAQEKKTWAIEKASMEDDMEAKKKELAKIQVTSS